MKPDQPHRQAGALTDGCGDAFLGDHFSRFTDRNAEARASKFGRNYDSLRLFLDSGLTSVLHRRCGNREEIILADQNSHLRSIVDQDGAVILDAKAGRISTLNSTGAFVWQALKRGEHLEAIAADLARMTGEPVDAVKDDIAAFIEALEKQDLLPH